MLEDVAHGATPFAGTQPDYHSRLPVPFDGSPSPLPVPEQSSGASTQRHPGILPLFVPTPRPLHLWPLTNPAEVYRGTLIAKVTLAEGQEVSRDKQTRTALGL